jgi:hypothetical protein
MTKQPFNVQIGFNKNFKKGLLLLSIFLFVANFSVTEAAQELEAKKSSLIVSLISLEQELEVCNHDMSSRDKSQCWNGKPKGISCKLGFMVKNQTNKTFSSGSIFYSSYELGYRNISVRNPSSSQLPKYLFAFYEILPGKQVVSDQAQAGKNATFGHIDDAYCKDLKAITFSFDGRNIPGWKRNGISRGEQLIFESKVAGVDVSFDVNDFNKHVEEEISQRNRESDLAESYRKKGLPSPDIKIIEKCAGHLYGYTKISSPIGETRKILVEEANNFLDLLGGLEKRRPAAVKAVNIGEQISVTYFSLASQNRGAEVGILVRQIKNIINLECAEYGANYGIKTYLLPN